MITGTFSHIETDKEHQKELVKMYNDWQSDVMFSSHIDQENKYWLKMKEYCLEHPDILDELWLDMRLGVGTVGHFTMMLDEVHPHTIEFLGYCPLPIVELVWTRHLRGFDNSDFVNNGTIK